MEALTSRAAAIPQIDLTPPRALIGKSTVEAIRSGVIYGFAAQVDGIVARLREELGEETEAIATGGLAAAIVPFCELIDDIDEMLTLTGLRLIHERNLTLKAGLSRFRLGACDSLHDPWELGGITIPNRVVLAPLAGIGNWFVRLQAKRYGAGLAVSEMVSSHAIHYGNRKTLDELLVVDPRERAGGPVAIQLFGQDPDDHALGRRGRRRARRRPDRPQHGLPGAQGDEDRRRRRADQRPRHRGRRRARRARGLRPAGHGQAARRDRSPAASRASSSRAGSSRTRASPV